MTLTSTGARAMAAAAVSRAKATMGATMMAMGLMPPPSEREIPRPWFSFLHKGRNTYDVHTEGGVRR